MRVGLLLKRLYRLPDIGVVVMETQLRKAGVQRRGRVLWFSAVTSKILPSALMSVRERMRKRKTACTPRIYLGGLLILDSIFYIALI